MESNRGQLYNILRREPKKVVLSDPRRHLLELEPHQLCLLGAEIIERLLLLQMPSKTERRTG